MKPLLTTLISKHRPYRKAAILLGLFLFFDFWFVRSLDPDFGWHLMTGRYILAHGVPKHDLFSYSMPSFEWINHEWLHDAFVATLEKLGGYRLLAASFAALWTLALWAALRGKLRVFTLYFTAWAMLSFAGIRPNIWSFLGIVALEYILEKKSRYFWLLFPLFSLWANLHGSFSFGLVVLLVVAVYRRSRPLLFWAAAAIPASFINPYGPRVYLEVLRTALDSQLRWRITEWAPFPFQSPFWASAYLVLFIGLFFGLKERPKQTKYALTATTLVMTMSSVRHFVLLAATSAQHFEDLVDKTNKLLLRHQPRRRVMVIAVLTIVVPSLLYVGYIMVTVTKRPDPAKALAYLGANPCPGNLFAHYDLGGQIIWKLPGTKTFIDGRMPSWSDPKGSIATRFIKITTDPDARRREFTDLNVRCVLFPPDAVKSRWQKEDPNKFTNALAADGWARVAGDLVGSYNLWLAPQK